MPCPKCLDTGEIFVSMYDGGPMYTVPCPVCTPIARILTMIRQVYKGKGRVKVAHIPTNDTIQVEDGEMEQVYVAVKDTVTDVTIGEFLKDAERKE